jgi:hypothetical protein
MKITPRGKSGHSVPIKAFALREGEIRELALIRALEAGGRQFGHHEVLFKKTEAEVRQILDSIHKRKPTGATLLCEIGTVSVWLEPTGRFGVSNGPVTRANLTRGQTAVEIGTILLTEAINKQNAQDKAKTGPDLGLPKVARKKRSDH